MEFKNAKELLELCRQEGCPISQIMRRREIVQGETTEEAVDRRMATSLPGVFAAGDCTGAPLQVSKAVGEGLVAALSAAEYLDKQTAAAGGPADET